MRCDDAAGHRNSVCECVRNSRRFHDFSLLIWPELVMGCQWQEVRRRLFAHTEGRNM